MASEQPENTQDVPEKDTVTTEKDTDVVQDNTENTGDAEAAGAATGDKGEVKETPTPETGNKSPTRSVGENDVERGRLLSGVTGSLVSFHDIVYTVKATPSGKCCACCRNVQKEILHKVRYGTTPPLHLPNTSMILHKVR